jgi:hypothetical protein
MKVLDPTTTGIVLLDDDPFMLKLLTHMLAQLGLRASSLATAAKRLCSRSPGPTRWWT